MKRFALTLALAVGCAAQPHVEVMVPEALAPSKSVAVVRPEGRSFGFDPDRLQGEIAKGLHRAGFDRVSTEGGRADLVALASSELMARPLEDDGHFTVERFRGERVLAVLEIRDSSGTVVYRAVRIDNLSSALTEARMAAVLVQPLELSGR